MASLNLTHMSKHFRINWSFTYEHMLLVHGQLMNCLMWKMSGLLGTDKRGKKRKNTQSAISLTGLDSRKRRKNMFIMGKYIVHQVGEIN